MTILIECPVCENRFRLDTEQAKQKSTQCAMCKNSFDVASNQAPHNEPVTVAPVAASIPAQSEDEQPMVLAKPDPAPSSIPVAQSVPTTPVGKPQFEVAKSTRARAMIRRRKSPAVPIILGFAALFSAVGLIIVFNYVDPLRKPEVKEEEFVDLNKLGEKEAAALKQKKSAKDGSASSGTQNETGSVFRTDGKSDEVEEPPVNAPPDKPPRYPVYRYFNKSQIDDFWDNNHRHFVRLRVTRPDSSRYVPATIVDVRGWVVTSLSAVRNAQEIEVQNAAAKIHEFNGVRLDSTDLIRGVIATDPAHDLVLLSINRALVTSLTDVKIGKTDSMVGGKYLVQCACPGGKNWVWPKETQLARQKPVEEMNFDMKSQIEELKLDESTKYLMHTGYVDTSIGAALFSIEGELVAINTSVTDESRNVMAVPAEVLKELLANATDEPMALSTLAN